MIEIPAWCNVGNSIIQLENMLHLALYHNHTLKVPDHSFFDIDCVNKLLLKTIDDTKNKTEILKDPYKFFRPIILKDIPKDIIERDRPKILNILREAFKIKNLESLGEKDVVIHIRSRDLFGNRPHSRYLVPPLSYYVDILDENNFDNIILVAQDTLNPTIDKLRKLYPQIVYKKQSLVEDVSLILRAQNVINSFGSFVPYLLLFSDYIKNIYKPSYEKWYNHWRYSRGDVIIHTINLDNYYKKMIPWRNSPQQREVLMNYDLNLA